MRLEEKVAIVTGAGRGIGEGIAREFAAEGASVVCVDVNEADIRRVAERCGGRAYAHVANVSAPEECDAVIARAVEEFGRLDVLVHNAGINRDAMLHKMSD